MEDFDKDYLQDFLAKLEEKTDKDIELTKQTLDSHIKAINNSLKDIEKRIKSAEEEGDENLYRLETNRKQLILQRLNDLKTLTDKIKR